MDHYNSPIYGMLIHRRHLLQTLVRLLLKFVSTVSMKILFLSTQSQLGLDSMVYLDLECYSCTSIIRPLRLKQTNSRKTNAPRSIVGTLTVEGKQKSPSAVGPVMKGCTPPHPEGSLIHPIKPLRFVKGSFWTVLPEVDTRLMRLVIPEIW